MAASGFRLTHGKDIAPTMTLGKDHGLRALGPAASYETYCVAKYVWVDADGNTRCKSKTITQKPTKPDDCGIWLFNGDATGQESHGESDVYLVPRGVFNDPFRGPPHVMVMCEVVTGHMEPGAGNWRAAASEVMGKFSHCEPWFGMEQEYTVMQMGARFGEFSGVPAGFSKDGSQAAPGNMYYCASGAEFVPMNMRNLMEDHYACCMAAGIKISGTNLEIGPGQGEFQIGPCRGAEIGDHVILARFLLHMAAEKYGVAIDMSPKPVKGWAGNGLHCNFSARQTRAEGGLKAIDACCKAMGEAHAEMMSTYGEGNEARCDGTDGAPEMKDFSYRISSRTSSVRIPRNVQMVGRGHLEDRRPGGNADPYRVALMVMKVCGPVL